MPAASLKLSAKPAAPQAAAANAARPNAAASTFLGGCDDDDDFVSPPSASRARARPLKPCNGNGGAASRRPYKKVKPSYSSSAKENLSGAGGAGSAEKVTAAVPRAAETLAAGLGPGVSSGAPEGNETTDRETRGLSRYGSAGSKLDRSVKKASHRYGNCKSNSSPFPNSSESRVSALCVSCDVGGGHCEEARAVASWDCTPIPDERHATVKVKGSETPAEGNQSRLIEARVLESDAKYECVIVDSYVSKGFGSGILDSLNDNRKEKETGVVSECGFEFHSRNHPLQSLESKLQKTNVNYDSGGGDCKEARDLGLQACNLVSQQRIVAAGHCVTPENESVENISGPEICKENYCSNSTESKLLESQTPHDLEGGGYDDFEIGTQLNELINLCMEENMEGHSNCRTSPIEQNKCDSKSLESENQVLCPLCGSDISEFNEERRQLHTNNCLDEPSKVHLQDILNHIVFESLVLLENTMYYCSLDRSLHGLVSIFVCGMLIVIRILAVGHHCLPLRDDK
jgi:DNA cross-link repair 1A protein